jgi:hypothetical protein
MAPPADGTLRPWIELLKDPVAVRRLEATLVLGSFGALAEAAVPALCAVLADPDPIVSKTAADAIIQISRDPGTVIPRLVELLQDPSADTRKRAVEVLCHFGPAAQAAVVPLAAALKDHDAPVRRWAAFALGEIGPEAKAAVPDLLDYRGAAPDLRGRAVATAALKKIDPDALARAIEAQEAKAPGEVLRLVGHRYWVQSVAYAPDGRSALSGSGQPAGLSEGDADCSIRWWDLEAGQEKRCLTGHDGWVTGVAFSRDGRHCLRGS